MMITNISERFAKQSLICCVLILLSGLAINGQKSLYDVYVQGPTTNALELSQPGHAVIAGLLPAHEYYDQIQQSCKTIDEYGIHYIVGMIFAIATVNHDPTLLPGISLGYEIRDTCYSSLHTARATMELLLHLLPFKEGLYGNYYCHYISEEHWQRSEQAEQLFLGIIGSTLSDSAKATANMLSKSKNNVLVTMYKRDFITTI